MKEFFLITGSAGFVRRRLVDFITRRYPHHRKVLLARKSASFNGRMDSRTRLITGDLTRESVWRRVPRGITCVFHLAAVVPSKKKSLKDREVYARNIRSARLLAKFCRQCPNLQSVIYTSSVSVYAWRGQRIGHKARPDPQNAYGRAKLECEKILKKALKPRVHLGILRMSSIYGTGQSYENAVSRMIHGAMEQSKIIIDGKGDRPMDFIHVDDAVRAIHGAYLNRLDGAVCVGSGRAVTLNGLARAVNDVFTRGQTPIIHMRGKTPADRGLRLDISPARRNLGIKPMSLKQGLVRLKNAQSLDVS